MTSSPEGRQETAVALLPCPFCGGAANLYPPTYSEENPSEVIGPAVVNCHDCTVAVIGDWEDDAIAAWNRRVLIPAKPAVEVVEALELERFTLHYDPVEEKLFALLSEDGEWVRHSDVYTLSPPTKTPTVELEPLRENLKRQAGILDEMAFKMRLPPGDNNLEDASAFMRDAVTALSQAPATPDAQTEVEK